MSNILPHLPADVILAAYARAAGKELESGKFESPESSAALAANVFGYFCGHGKAAAFPRLGWLKGDVERVDLERCVRFPWQGGLHPWLDAVLETREQIAGIESKRYEPFRAHSRTAGFSAAYDRDVWGSDMGPYLALKAAIQTGARTFRSLDAVQLIKHALGLRTEGQRCGKEPVLLYIHAEPQRFPRGADISLGQIEHHRDELQRFSDAVAGAAVPFHAMTHRALCRIFIASADPELAAHGAAVHSAFLSDQYD